MDMTSLIRLLPTMEILEEAFRLEGWRCDAFISQPNVTYRNVRLFTGQDRLFPDVVYTLREGEENFPTDDYAYICVTPTEGKANHICCPGGVSELVLDFLLDLYSRFQHKEMLMDQLTYRGGTIQELCQLGQELLGNPVCIHDDWFIVIGISDEVLPLMAPESRMTSTAEFLPQIILDVFRDDSDYLETYAHKTPQIWDGGNDAPSSLYVNLWDGSIYRGRLIVVQHNRPIRKADHMIAQVLTQRAIFLLQRKIYGQVWQHQSMDDLIHSLLSGKPLVHTEQVRILRLLMWDKADTVVCIRLRSQQGPQQSIMSHVLHSDLFQLFPGSYVLLSDQEHTVLVNMGRTRVPYAHLAHHIAPLCRDNCLYAGISSPVDSISEWHLAHYQAGVALDTAFRRRDDQWILPFSQCALEHTLHNLSGGLQPWHMVSPELRMLREYDKQNGTQFFETFREYLLQERDIPRTARNLIIHRTTLLYRLKKIQSLLHTDLEDPWQRLYLTISLWILEHDPQPQG